MIRRALEDRLRQLLTGFPVVTLTGPRQSGKTTLAKAVFSLVASHNDHNSPTIVKVRLQ